MDAIYKNSYNGINKNLTMIDPNTKLGLIDVPLINRLRMTPMVNIRFAKILQQIDDIIYNNSSQDNYYPQFSVLINHFIKNSDHLKKIGDINNFLGEISDGIGGIVCLALTLALLSSVERGTKTSIFLYFIAPNKYRGIM
jgi:hypothetical protein